MNGWLFLAIGAALTATDLAIGALLLRRDPGVRSPELIAPPSARAGWIILIVSPLFLLVFAAIAFGVFPVEGIEPVSLGGER